MGDETEKKEPKDYTVRAITYNLANKNPSKEVVEDLLMHSGIQKDKPDVLVFSLQEAGNSFLNGEDIAVRMLKRKKLDKEYDIIYSDGFNVRTKAGSYFTANVPQTRLIVAVKRTIKDQTLIVDPHFVREPGHFVRNKGGVTAQLWIGDKKIGLAAVHMHSESEEHRKEQVKEIKNTVLNNTDANLILGDLNERLDNKENFCSDDSRTWHTLEDIKDKNYLNKYNPLVKGNSAWGDEFEFADVQEATYIKTKKDSAGKDVLKFQKGRNRVGAGVLDSVGIVNKNKDNVVIKFAKTEKVANSVLVPEKEDASINQKKLAKVVAPAKNGKIISDHKAVIVDLVITAMPAVTPEFKKMKDLLKELEDKIKQKSNNGQNSFLVTVASRYSIHLEGKSYPVPKRVHELYTKLNNSEKSYLEIITEVKNYCEKPEFLKRSFFTSANTQTFLQEFKTETVRPTEPEGNLGKGRSNSY